MLIELFSLGITAEAIRAIIGSKSAISLQRGPVDQKFQVEGVAPHQPFFFFSENSGKWSFAWYKKFVQIFLRLSQSTRLTDRRTDRQTEFSSLDRVCIACSAVKHQNEAGGMRVGCAL